MRDLHHNEHQLLEEVRKGDKSAFEQIFRIYWRELYLVARNKLQSHDEAEEVIQSIFSNLWEKRSTLLINDLSYYLHASVKNRILNIIRSKITKEKYWAYYRNFLPQDAELTAESVAYDDLDAAVQEAVNLLPEKSREVFKLSRMEGKTNAEIARLLSLSEKAIEYHITKSVRTLKVHLKDFIT
jgi:RNA polymerase sigma-70 factor (family 1)